MTAPNSSLPEWTKDAQFRLSAGGSKDFKLVEALAIAWESLKEITDERCELYHGDQAADAMRRIAELGK